jgi:hypothetical protein
MALSSGSGKVRTCGSSCLPKGERDVTTPLAAGDDAEIQGLDKAPEILVEGYRGATLRAGLVKLNFFTNVFHPGDRRLTKKAALTMAMPHADFEEVVVALVSLRDELRAAHQKIEGAGAE